MRTHPQTLMALLVEHFGEPNKAYRNVVEHLIDLRNRAQNGCLFSERQIDYFERVRSSFWRLDL